MIRKPFLLKIFEAADMQRWNDKIRPVDLRELDKQAHKMIITYLLGKFEDETNSENFNWIEIIEGGIFEFCSRCDAALRLCCPFREASSAGCRHPCRFGSGGD